MSSKKRRDELREIRNPLNNLSHSEQKILKDAKELHLKIFSEEYDHMWDSTVDAKERAANLNPMSVEYQDQVNLKRKLLGVSPLDKSGMSVDNSSMELCIIETRAKLENRKTEKTEVITDILKSIDS